MRRKRKNNEKGENVKLDTVLIWLLIFCVYILKQELSYCFSAGVMSSQTLPIKHNLDFDYINFRHLLKIFFKKFQKYRLSFRNTLLKVSLPLHKSNFRLSNIIFTSPRYDVIGKTLFVFILTIVLEHKDLQLLWTKHLYFRRIVILYKIWIY